MEKVNFKVNSMKDINYLKWLLSISNFYNYSSRYSEKTIYINVNKDLLLIVSFNLSRNPYYDFIRFLRNKLNNVCQKNYINF